MGKLLVKRIDSWADKFSAYRIFVDGVDVGKIREGEEWSRSLANGAHTLELKIGWFNGSQTEAFVMDGDNVEFIASSRVNWKGLRDVLMHPWKYFEYRYRIRLERFIER